MKVGTDGVLLGAWCRIEPDRDEAILDIGSGTGLIALQLAQRTEGFGARVEAVEVDPAACDVAWRNFEACEWRDRLGLHCASIQEFAGFYVRNVASGGAERGIEGYGARAAGEVDEVGVARGETNGAGGVARFDLIVSNPPFFVGALASPDAARTLARHTQSLSYDDLMECCRRLLKPHGRVSLVVPTGAETAKMIGAARACGFAVSRRTEVHSTPKSGPKRTLLEFSRLDFLLAERGRFCRGVAALAAGDCGVVESGSDDDVADCLEVAADVLVIGGSEAGSFSAEYRALTEDFYLYF